MALALEEYGLIGDTRTAALVGRDGSIDWLCLPRFDSGACFAALLGDERHGRWRIAPALPATSRHRYRPATLVLETDFTCADGSVRVVDCMAGNLGGGDVVRLVEGLSGCVRMRMELVIRFDYGRVVPWVRRRGPTLSAIAGPDALLLETPVDTRGEGLTTIAEFTVSAGDRVPSCSPGIRPTSRPERRLTRCRRSRPSAPGGGTGPAGWATTASTATPSSDRS